MLGKLDGDRRETPGRMRLVKLEEFARETLDLSEVRVFFAPPRARHWLGVRYGEASLPPQTRRQVSILRVGAGKYKREVQAGG